MPCLRIAIPVYFPGWLHGPLRRAKHSLLDGRSQQLNLWGDRDVEWSFIAAHLPRGPGYALDFGSGGSYVSLIAARRGFNVVALDLEPHHFYWCHPNVSFVQGDLMSTDWAGERFDVVINCSTVEHVGLVGRYSIVQERMEGDLEAMARLRELMNPGAVMLLTVPVGRDAVFRPLCRVYGESRLPALLGSFVVEREEFWLKNTENRWVMCKRETALRSEASVGSWNPGKNVYALGCFILRRPQG